MNKYKAMALLQELCLYTKYSRGVGHTQLLVNGLKEVNAECFFLVAEQGQARLLRHEVSPKVRIITLEQIDDGFLRGLQMPILIDHRVLEILVSSI